MLINNSHKEIHKSPNNCNGLFTLNNCSPLMDLPVGYV